VEALNVDELQKLIVPAFNEAQLKKHGVPSSEMQEFQRYKIVPAELLVNAPWNYKEDDVRTEDALEQNMKLQGQVENLNVRVLETGYFEVGNGNHRNKVFKRNGREFVLVCDHGDISQAEFQRRVILQNDTRWKNNEVKFAELIQEIAQEIPLEQLQMGMLYSKEELTAYTQLLDFNMNDFKFDGGNTGHMSKGQKGEGGKQETLIIDVPYETLQLWFDAVARLQTEFPELETHAQVLEHCLQGALMAIEGVKANDEEE